MIDLVKHKNYIEFNDKCYFHPGYFIEENIECYGLSQKEFAAQLGTSEKTVSKLVNGKQSLTIDLASKISRMTGQSAKLWLRFQAAFDAALAEISSLESMEMDKDVLESIDYQYFVDHFNAPSIRQEKDGWMEQIKWLRERLNISSLNALKNRDLSLNIQALGPDAREKNIICSNVMLMLAKKQFQSEEPDFNESGFEKAVQLIKTKMNQTDPDLNEIKSILSETGIDLAIFPNLKNAMVRGFVKKQGNRLLLMVSDVDHSLESFWLTLFHELGHIQNGDYASITASDMKNPDTEIEQKAVFFAASNLIPADEYDRFIQEKDFSVQSIRDFSEKIGRIPGIVTGQLLSDGFLDSQKDSSLISSTRTDFHPEPVFYEQYPQI